MSSPRDQNSNSYPLLDDISNNPLIVGAENNLEAPQATAEYPAPPPDLPEANVEYPASPEPPRQEVFYGNVEYPTIPEQTPSNRADNVNLDNPPANNEELPLLLKPHPLFQKSYLLTYSHFIIGCIFVYGMYSYSSSWDYKDFYPAFLAEYVLSLLHYFLRLVYFKRLERSANPFNKYEIVPEIIRVLACLSLFGAEYMRTNEAPWSKYLSESFLLNLFVVANIVGCLARFNFTFSLFSSSMANLAVSILFGMLLFAVDRSGAVIPGKTQLEHKTITILGTMIFGCFMLFIAVVKAFTMFVDFVVAMWNCSRSRQPASFVILANLWGVDYLLFSCFLTSTSYLMYHNWESGHTWISHAQKYSGYGYLVFYPIYTLCNLFLPLTLEENQLAMLRNFDVEEIDDVIRDNMVQRQRGGTVREVKTINSAEKMITLFQVSPFFFSETQVKDKNKTKFAYSENETPECLICFSKPPECIILKCMHGGVCADCARSILLKTPNCPFCRAKVQSIKVIEKRDVENTYIVKETMVVK
jgi:hypothetical protein